MSLKKPKLKLGLFDQNPIEAALRDVAHETTDSLKNDLLKGSITSTWEQLLKGTREVTKADAHDAQNEGPVEPGKLQKGQEVDIFNKDQWKRVEPGINYAAEIIQSHETSAQREQGEVRARMQEIVIELKQISKSMKELEVEIKDVDIDFIPAKPGKYQLNFLEWVVIQLKNARLRIQDSATWMKAVTGKKEKKGYWTSFKKHGTSFSLSGERNVATQVG